MFEVKKIKHILYCFNNINKIYIFRKITKYSIYIGSATSEYTGSGNVSEFVLTVLFRVKFTVPWVVSDDMSANGLNGLSVGLHPAHSVTLKKLNLKNHNHSVVL